MISGNTLFYDDENNHRVKRDIVEELVEEGRGRKNKDKKKNKKKDKKKNKKKTRKPLPDLEYELEAEDLEDKVYYDDEEDKVEESVEVEVEVEDEEYYDEYYDEDEEVPESIKEEAKENIPKINDYQDDAPVTKKDPYTSGIQFSAYSKNTQPIYHPPEKTQNKNNKYMYGLDSQGNPQYMDEAMVQILLSNPQAMKVILDRFKYCRDFGYFK